ncbi:protein yippee-like At3g08990 [Punica granatum]|uniref:Protein yippee-like At3g08990 n=2 Tax=Punica granatum TaxID=22663 RepID=A0A6P8C358_PUNGR|nr:protein yippee-like At3g08990 [Punica granatum]PKI34521.1 hypothetical protein CRG98_045058 [Punica granatum]
MGRLFVITLDGNFYCCKFCNTHLALVDDIMSKSFHCRHGRAYLFDRVVNITMGDSEERMMITGMHTVADIFCVGCGSIVGWKYEAAHEKSQKYKEGKFILERFKVLGPEEGNYAGEEAPAAGSDTDEA